MKNNKGVSLVTVVVMIIIMIIVASTGIIVGNKLVKEAKEEQEKQNLIAIEDLVNKYHVKIGTSGVLMPGIESFPGVPNPVVGEEQEGYTDGMAGEDWYLLNDIILKQEGIEGARDVYLVNYKLNKVIIPSKVSDIFEEITDAENNI